MAQCLWFLQLSRPNQVIFDSTMHELSIASAIVDTVTQEIKRQNLPPVQTVVVRIGALSGVVPEALQFGFEAIIPDTLLANTKLQIERTPVQGKCRGCCGEFSVQEFVFACPSCQSGQIEVTRGEELEIAYLEVDGVENRR
jgi:hydrogenase nickel incorporation protein HypA/HybF